MRGSIAAILILGAAIACAGCRWAGSNGGLDFSDGTCREHRVEYACSPLRETCGCAEGDACRPELDGSRQCVPAGTAGQGEACTTDADCDNGLLCALGRCDPFCDLRPNGLGCDTGPCVQVFEDPEAPFGGCADDACDPVSTDGCPAGGPGCSLVHIDTDSESFTRCIELGPGEHGASCEAEGCTAGHVCLRSSITGTVACAKVCERGDDSPCQAIEAGLRCTGVFEDPSEVDGRDFGFCER